MPPLVGAAVAAAVGSALVGALASTLVSVAISIALGMIGTALFGKPKGPKAPGSSITSVVRSAEEPRRIIYGQRMISGVLTFAATGRFDEDTIRDLHVVIALCDGPITEIGDVYFNDVISTDPRFYGDNGFRLSKHGGGTAQDADAALVAALPSLWTTNHQLRAVAYIYARLIWINSPLIWNSGIPNIKAMVRGVHLFDPRLGAARYSRNPALALRDYLLLAENAGGFGAAADEVDDAYAIAAANACDEVVPITIVARQGFTASAGGDLVRINTNPRGFTLGDRVRVSTEGGALPAPLVVGVDYWWMTYSGQDPNKEVFGRLATSYANALAGAFIGLTTDTTGTPSIWRTGQVRYCCDAVVQLDQAPSAIIEDLLGSMAGNLVYTQGRWRMFAGVARTPEPGEITVGMLRAPLMVQTRTPRRELFNGVRGTIPDLSKYGQETSFPPISNSFYAADDGAEIWQDISLPCVTSPLRAQRIGKVHIERARQGIVITAPMNWSALPFAIGDVRAVSDDALGWDHKLFEIVNWTLAEGGGVDLVMQEYAAAVYDWNSATGADYDPAPDTGLPDWSVVQAPGLALSDDYVLSAGQPITRLLLAVTMPDDEMIIRYRVHYRLQGAAAWSPAADDATEILGVTDGATYEVEVQAINTLGAPSPWTRATRQVVGQLGPPADVQNFAVNIIGDQAHLSWDPVPDLDLNYYRIRIASNPAETVWSNAVDLVVKVARPATSVTVPAMMGAFMIKAVDFKGVESVNPAISSSTIASLVSNVVVLRQEAPGWSGTHSGTAAIDGALQLESGGLWDSVPGLWDDLTTTWDLTGGGSAGAGSYVFGPVDLGARFTSRVSAALDVGQASLSDIWDDLPGLWDDLARLWDGGSSGATNVALDIATTDDDPASGTAVWSAWRPFVVGDYTCRGYQFRARLTSSESNLTPVVYSLAVTIDMPDRVDPIPDQASLAAGSIVTYAVPFAAAPAIGIVGKNLQTGDYWVITSETAVGFTIRFFNASNAGVSRNFSGLAKGYGRKAA